MYVCMYVCMYVGMYVCVYSVYNLGSHEALPSSGVNTWKIASYSQGAATWPRGAESDGKKGGSVRVPQGSRRVL